MSEYDTAPTIETVLQRIGEGFTQVNERLDRIEGRLGLLEKKLDRFNNRLATSEAEISLLQDDIEKLKSA